EREASPAPGTATFAAGCFWGVEYKFRQVKGVTDAVSGYTGGSTKGPTYAKVCTDRTGHAEAVRVTFDPATVSYEDLVRFFFTIHDPTQVDRQGPDVGTQYRSVIFYYDEAQKETALKVMAQVGASGLFRKPLATALVPASEFTRAEEYHQRYYEKNDKKSCAF
ncbi:MAG TPA: peptide-methionine (S)-S-oxide reductase MsrA, partial [Acidobacteriota bacterium]|nr:peptide-methionine (S)-S-oxide reductase MsrA [Acidobacteriota bacterium]